MPFQFRKDSVENLLNAQFPSQGQGNPPLYYSLSEVVVPTFNINDAATGSVLPEMLQTAWDFSTGHSLTTSGTSNLITNTGFWKVDVLVSGYVTGGAQQSVDIRINDGVGSKVIWQKTIIAGGAASEFDSSAEGAFVVFLRSGDTLQVSHTGLGFFACNVWYRQIATVNGTLTNPLGFSF